jgi:hypothetical protein
MKETANLDNYNMPKLIKRWDMAHSREDDESVDTTLIKDLVVKAITWRGAKCMRKFDHHHNVLYGEPYYGEDEIKRRGG